MKGENYMRRMIKRFISIVLVIILTLSMSVSTFATSFQKEQIIDKDGGVVRDVLPLQTGTMYLEETSNYRVVFFVKCGGETSYAIMYKNNPGVVYSGEYYNVVDIYSVQFPNIVNDLLNQKPTAVIDFASRPREKSTVLSETAALEYCKKYAPGWKAPINSKVLGNYTSGGITASVTESVNGIAKEENVISYYIGDSLIALAALITGLKLDKIMDLISNVAVAGGDYIAQVNGTLTYFTVDNTRTKMASISGEIHYWAGWDVIYGVYSGDKSTFVEKVHDFAHSDYDKSVDYFGQKAIDNYSKGN